MSYQFELFDNVNPTTALTFNSQATGSLTNPGDQATYTFTGSIGQQVQFNGLEPGSNDNFRSTYTVFAKIATQQYPALFKDTPIPDVKDIEDKSFITGAQARMSSGGAESVTVRSASVVLTWSLVSDWRSSSRKSKLPE